MICKIMKSKSSPLFWSRFSHATRSAFSDSSAGFWQRRPLASFEAIGLTPSGVRPAVGPVSGDRRRARARSLGRERTCQPGADTCFGLLETLVNGSCSSWHCRGALCPPRSRVPKHGPASMRRGSSDRRTVGRTRLCRTAFPPRLPAGTKGDAFLIPDPSPWCRTLRRRRSSGTVGEALWLAPAQATTAAIPVAHRDPVLQKQADADGIPLRTRDSHPHRAALRLPCSYDRDGIRSRPLRTLD